MWILVKPETNFGILQDFGSLCYRHVSEKLERMLDDRVQVAILVGYHSTCSYKLFLANENKVVISMDMKFDEGKTWKWPNQMLEGDDSSHMKITLQDDEHEVEIELYNLKRWED